MKNTKSITTDSGITITVTINRYERAEELKFDTICAGTKVSFVDNTEIIITTADGKTIAGDEVETLIPMFDKKAIASGAVAKVGNAYIGQDIYDLITDLIAQVEAITPKTAAQAAEEQKIKTIEDWKNSPEGQLDAVMIERHERLMRMMDNPNSDL